MGGQNEERKKCAQDVFFSSISSLNEHAVRLHGAIFTGKEAHLADHKGSAVVKSNMELEQGAAYKIGNLMLFDHVHNEKGHVVMRYYPSTTRRRAGGGNHESLL